VAEREQEENPYSWVSVLMCDFPVCAHLRRDLNPAVRVFSWAVLAALAANPNLGCRQENRYRVRGRSSGYRGQILKNRGDWSYRQVRGIR